MNLDITYCMDTTCPLKDNCMRAQKPQSMIYSQFTSSPRVGNVCSRYKSLSNDYVMEDEDDILSRREVSYEDEVQEGEET